MSTPSSILVFMWRARCMGIDQTLQRHDRLFVTFHGACQGM